MNKSWIIIGSITTTLLLWASAFVGIRAGLEAFSPTHLSLLRYATASIVLIIYALIAKVRLPERKDVLKIMLLGFIGITLYNVALNYGELSVTAGVASFIVNSGPIFTTILASIFLKERISCWGVFAIVISFIGVLIISLDDLRKLQFNEGILLLIVAALTQAIYFVFQKPLLRKYRPLELTTFMILSGTIFMLPFSPGIIEAIALAPIDKTITVLYLGIFPGALAYLTWSVALSKIRASLVSSFLFLIPLLTIGIAWIYLSEIPTLYTWIGGFLILIGVIIMNIVGKK
ncbi:DMT family transporter [Paenibacillus sp. N1-5-1-14]|uniref:DMT family transporter n=1 Tax=Paenibacillus radicibacter TaxID=2972488 RepID=UPI0021596BEA|nr:DMT family transporter [Paenibacillus radicibacter]MCR8643806.1 DMT family transporter [Paenibacillus radicibacter]